MEKAPDDVSNIHNRFSLTLLNPSSHYFSLAASLIIAAVISLTTYFAYLSDHNTDEVWYRLPAVIVVLVLTQLLDTRFTKKREYSKSLHSSLFANMLWIVTMLMGLLASFVLSKDTSLFFVTFGDVPICKFQNRNLHHNSRSKYQKSMGHMLCATNGNVFDFNSSRTCGSQCLPNPFH